MPTNTVQALTAQLLLLGAAMKGLSIEELYARYQIDPSLFEDTDSRLPATTVSLMWKEIPLLCNDPSFGLHLAEMVKDGPLPWVFSMLQSCDNLEETFRMFSRFERIFHDVEVHTFSFHKEGLQLRHHGGVGEYRVPVHGMECAFATLVLMARLVTGHPICPTRVVFAHERTSDLEAHQRVFGVTPSFDGTQYLLEFSAEDIARKNLQPSSQLKGVLQRHAEAVLQRLSHESEFLRRIHQSILTLLPEGTPSLPQVARSMATSTRTLQRRLMEEKTTLTKEIDRLRHASAITYLADPERSLAEIAFVLGFSEQTAFHRAFVRWTGFPPGDWRKKSKALDNR